MQLGASLLQMNRGAAVHGILPTDPVVQLLCLVFVLLMITLTPQAYLAWTLKPLNEADFADEGTP